MCLLSVQVSSNVAQRTNHSQNAKQTFQNARFVRDIRKTQKQTAQNERFMRDIRKNAEANLPKRAFRTRHWQKTKANLPKRAFRTRHSQKRRSKPPKTSVSYETFAKAQKQTFENERFVRDIRKNAKANLPKLTFPSRHSQKRRNKPPETSVSYETFAKKQKQTAQNERFVRDIPKTQKQTAQNGRFVQTSQNERFVPDIRKNAETNLPKQTFRTRHSQKRRSKPPKTSVSYETFAKEDETFQNDRVIRDIRKNGEGNLPKRAFRMRHSQKQQRKTSKTSVSYETCAKTEICDYNAPMSQRTFQT